MMRVLVFLIAVLVLLQGIQSFRWTSTFPAGSTFYLCVGDSVTVPWQFELSPGDTIRDIMWYFEGNSEELIAFFARGTFVNTASYANRVHQVGNAGLTLDHLTPAESGRYQIEVTGVAATGNSFSHRQPVQILVVDHFLKPGAQLHVQQGNDVVRNTVTDQWAIPLLCGPFDFQHPPAFSVDWVIPDGTTVRSSGFEGGYFTLLLDNPIKSGNYACKLSDELKSSSCLNAAHQGEVTLTLDNMAARLLLLEKASEDWRNGTEARYSALQAENQKLQNQTEALLEENRVLQATVQRLESQYTLLDARVGGMDGSHKHQISFHVTGLLNPNPPTDTPLVVNNILTNIGQAYDNSSGYFTAPVSGVFFFIATTGGVDSDTYVSFNLNADDTSIDYAFSPNHGGYIALSTVHGLIHLNVGQKVWIRSHGDTYNGAAAFSGFLVAED